MKSPILFIIFNRLDTTQKVFEKIKNYKPARLYIKSDGPRLERIGEEEIVQKTRDFVMGSIDWECEVLTSFENENLGCKENIQKALKWYFANEEQGIILEDDTVPNEQFFEFVDSKLIELRDDTKVMMISGSNLIERECPLAAPTKSQIAQVWGWATWRHKFQLYENDIRIRRRHISNVFFDIWKKIDLKAAVYFTACFLLVRNHRLNTWDYQLQKVMLDNNMSCVIPCSNLVVNIGISGAHSKNTDRNHFRKASQSNNNFKHAQEIQAQKWERTFSNIQYRKKFLKHLAYILFSYFYR